MTSDLTPENITKEQFLETLDRYDSLVNKISRTKSSKADAKTLVELDKYRYSKAPQLFNILGSEQKAMELSDVQQLVEWKLRHGKFRPALMGYVMGNSSELVRDTVKSALEAYKSGKGSKSDALDILKKLKGIGPATASLLLSVHNQENVIFFSDELYYWLCAKGVKSSLKYTSREYDELASAASILMKRLDVNALDLEKVAYVLIKEYATVSTQSEESKPTISKSIKEPSKPRTTKNTNMLAADAQIKRKSPHPSDTQESQPLRRSKRGKSQV